MKRLLMIAALAASMASADGSAQHCWDRITYPVHYEYVYLGWLIGWVWYPSGTDTVITTVCETVYFN